MSDVEHPPRTIWGWLVLLFVVGVGGFQLGWTTGRDKIRDENEQLRKISEWDLTGNLNRLGLLSQTVALQLQERLELQRLRSDVPRLQQSFTQANEKLVQQEEHAKEVAMRLSECTPETLKVPTGEARFIVPKRLAVGVTKTDTYFKTANINFAGKQYDVRPGSVLDATIDSVKYAITVMSVDGNECVFAISQPTNTAPGAQK